MRILPFATACTGVCVGYLYKNMTYERELQFQTHRHQALTTELGMLRAELDIHRKKIPQLQHALEEAEARETSRDERLLLASMFIVQGGWLVRMFMSRSGG